MEASSARFFHLGMTFLSILKVPPYAIAYRGTITLYLEVFVNDRKLRSLLKMCT